jgi:hypothetical protein
MGDLIKGCSILRGIKIRRLFQEEHCVKGCAWFGKHPDSLLHIPANVLRVLCAIFFAPIYLLIPHSTRESVEMLAKRVLWSLEFADTPTAFLFTAPGGGGIGQYEVTNYKPRWMLKVEFRNGQKPNYCQVPWSTELHGKDYTAISYPMDSAWELFKEARCRLLDPQPSEMRRWSLRDRRRISECLLFEYAKARERFGIPQGTEYVWLDEFCLFDGSLIDEREVEAQRVEEVGRLSDIFRDATQVCVFCHEVWCDHTSHECLWGNRIFTIGEILHASTVLVMTRRVVKGVLQSKLVSQPGSTFRRHIEGKAAEENNWHLYAIMQHSSNSGAVPWQAAIHSLIVEVIRRDEVGDFDDHRFLGKVLNGLLPRRARLKDLKGKDGWADLAWLLELNQGFYNAASLAAVCNLADARVPGHRWLGKPLEPRVGNERLEPLVIAFPVSLPHHDMHARPALSVIGPQNIPMRDMMRRDSAGLYTHKALRSVKRMALIIAAIFVIIGIIVFGVNVTVIIFPSTSTSPVGGFTAAIVIWYLTFTLYAIFELLVGTIFIVRKGWVVLEDSVWGSDPSCALKQVDRDLGLRLTVWGEQQLAPNWDTTPPDSGMVQTRSVTLFDTEGEVAVKANVAGRVNDLIILAVHGNGLSCMLLDRPVEAARVRFMASKVGMANLPPYALYQTTTSGTVYVGDYPQDTSQLEIPLEDLAQGRVIP